MLGVNFSYDENGNNELNFNLKVNELQINLGMWRSRDLTLFGKVYMMIKALGVSSLIYLASNINVPKDSGSNVNGRLFRFLWKNKRDRIKREGLYQDYDKGGLRITDISKMIKALRTISVDSERGHPNLKFAPEHFFKKYGGLHFLLLCNYHVNEFESIPLFYEDILSYYIDKSVLVENRPLIKFIRNYIRGSSGIFSISSLVRISMTSFPALTLFFVQKYSCLYNKKKITRWLEDMNFIFSW